MSHKQAARPKHIPQRTCLGCREVHAKRTLVRVVRGPDGARPDLTGKAPGRGAYIHNRRDCWERALKGEALDRALRATLTPAEREALRQYGLTMPEDEN